MDKKSATVTKKMESFWLCDCGKQYLQPVGDATFPVREKCECGKELYKIKDPDNVVTEFVNAEEWFIKEFDVHNKIIAENINRIHVWEDKRYMAEREARLAREKLVDLRNKMKNIVEHGARRHKDRTGLGLLKRKTWNWNFIRGMKRWAGNERPKEVKDGRG